MKNLDSYTIEFVFDFGYGYGLYSWFLSRPNYGRDGFWSSDSVWVYTTDDRQEYLKIGNMSKLDAVRYIKKMAKEHYKDAI